MARAPSPDGSPEVDFGAFRRSQSRAGNYQPATTSSSTAGSNNRSLAYSASTSPTVASNRAKPRQGGPRLGGLGLGGIHSSSPASNLSSLPAVQRESNTSVRAYDGPGSSTTTPPTRPLNIQRRSSSNRKPAPSPTVEDLKAAAPVTQVAQQSNAARKEGQTEKAFLYPEVGKPTMRTGAFVLERPVPDVMPANSQNEQPSTAQQLPSPPESPAEEPIEEFFGRSAPATPTKEQEGLVWARRPSLDSRNSDGSPNRKRMGMVERMLGGAGDRTSGQTDSDTLEVLDSKARDTDTESNASRATFESAQDDTGGEEITFGSPSQSEEAVGKTTAESPASVYEERSEPTQPIAAHQTDSSDSATSAVEPQTPEQSQEARFHRYDADNVGPKPNGTTNLEDLLNDRARAGYSIPQHADINGYYSDEEPHPAARSDRSASFLETDPADVGLVPNLPPPVEMSRTSSGRSSARSKSPVPPRPSRARRPPGSSNPASPTLSSSEFSGAEDNGIVSSSDEREGGAPAERSMMETLASERPQMSSRIPSSASTLSVHSSRPQALFYSAPRSESNDVAGDDTITPTLSRHASYAASPPVSPSATTSNSYEGLGLRLPSSLRGGKRNSRSLSNPVSSPPPVLSPLLPTSTSSSTLFGVKDEVESPTGSVPTTTTATSSHGGSAHVPNIVAHVDQLRRMSVDKDVAPVERLSDRMQGEQLGPRSDGDERRDSEGSARAIGDQDNDVAQQTDEQISTTGSSDLKNPEEEKSTDKIPDPSIATEQDVLRSQNGQRRGSSSSTGSGAGGVADIGVAAVGAIVTGGMAVGWAAWRGLSAAASFGLGRGADTTNKGEAEKEVIEKSETNEDGQISDSTPNLGALPGRFDVAERDDDSSEGEGAAFEDATASPELIHTEWGDVEFEAPQGFLEAFTKAMEEIGPEDEAANRAEEEQAAAAAYESAMQLHRETEAIEAAFRKPIRMRDGIVPERPRSPREDDDDEDAGDYDGEHRGEAYEELMDLVSPMFDSKNAKDAKYAPPPGLTGGGGGQSLSRSFSQQSSASSSSSKIAPRSPNPALKASLSPQMPKSRSLFGFANHARRASVDSDKSPPPSYTSQQAKSLASIGSDDDPTSVTSGNSKLTRKTKTRSIFGVRKSSSPADMPSIESQISDMTYVSYSSGRAAKRKSSLSSSKTQSSDPMSPISTTSNLSLDSTGSSAKSPSPLGGFVGRPRKPSLRKVSRYDHDSPSPPPPSKLYRVRFGNASKGIGLRSVAEDEAERAGGEEHAIRWVGVGRGNRYGNLLIQTDDSTDDKYAVQVNDIKKKWRVRNSKGYNRDWTTVRID
ncbi:hypothetical protein OIV83_001512 [Microbotryomycetes sp. JL201]|nr:hypothetical protein OIV83_001512 [Microbotryomycetes sp. JL201]